MYQQTRMLAKSLPKLAGVYETYGTEPFVWSIVAFQCQPTDATTESMSLLEEADRNFSASLNRFSSRTAALRRSAVYAQSRDTKASEEAHMGAWQFLWNSESWFCTVIPLDALRKSWVEAESTQHRNAQQSTSAKPPENLEIRQIANRPVTVTNQGSDFANSRSIEYCRLRFRSVSEVRVAEALDRRGVMYFANSIARLTAPNGRVNKEPDFLICHGGRWGILEVDGEPFHPPTRTVHDHERDRLFRNYGVKCVEHFDANRCYSEAEGVVTEILNLLERNG